MNTIRSMQAANQAPDKPGQELWRIRDREAGQRAYQETMQRFSPLTPENFNDACKFHEQVRREILQTLHA